MTRMARKGFLWSLGIVLLLLSIGCQEQNLTGTKKSRLIAAENLRLEKELAQRNNEIESLKKQHQKQIQQQKEELLKCQKEKQILQEKSQTDIKEQVADVLTSVMDENARLQEKVKNLKIEIEKLTKQIKTADSAETKE